MGYHECSQSDAIERQGRILSEQQTAVAVQAKDTQYIRETVGKIDTSVSKLTEILAELIPIKRQVLSLEDARDDIYQKIVDLHKRIDRHIEQADQRKDRMVTEFKRDHVEPLVKTVDDLRISVSTIHKTVQADLETIKSRPGKFALQVMGALIIALVISAISGMGAVYFGLLSPPTARDIRPPSVERTHQ